MDEAKIVLGLKQKNEKAFNELYYKYKNTLYFIIFDYLKNRENTEEVLQDTFLDIYNKIEQFSYNKNFKAWMFQIARNNALDFYRKKNNLVLDEDIVSSTKSYDTSEDIYHDLRMILKEDEFTVLILSAVYDIKHKDIASYLNKPVGTISWLYQEAKKKAKSFLKEVK